MMAALKKYPERCPQLKACWTGDNIHCNVFQTSVSHGNMVLNYPEMSHKKNKIHQNNITNVQNAEKFSNL